MECGDRVPLPPLVADEGYHRFVMKQKTPRRKLRVVRDEKPDDVPPEYQRDDFLRDLRKVTRPDTRRHPRDG